MKAVLIGIIACGIIGFQTGCTCECEGCCTDQYGETICNDPIIVERGECNDLDEVARQSSANTDEDCSFECR